MRGVGVTLLLYTYLPHLTWRIEPCETDLRAMVVIGIDPEDKLPTFHYRLSYKTLRDAPLVNYVVNDIVDKYIAWTPPPEPTVEDSPDHPEDEV